MTPPRRERLALGLLLVAIALVYLSGLAGAPVDWDDDLWLTDPVLAAAPAEAVRLAFTTTRDHNWAPALRLSFATWIHLGGPGALHAVALGLYLGLVAGTWVFLRRLGLTFGVVLGAVAPWALHPTKVECVSWLTGLKDVQSGAALAAAAVVATGTASPGRAALFAGLCALAGATKAATFPIPALILAALWAVHGREEAVRRTGAGVVVALGLALVGLAEWGAGPPDADAGDRLSRMVSVYGAFCSKLVPLSLPAALTPLPGSGPALAWGALVTGGMSALAVRDRRVALTLALWVFTLVPFVGLVHMNFFGSDRHLLFASLGPFLAVAMALGEVRAPALAALGRDQAPASPRASRRHFSLPPSGLEGRTWLTERQERCDPRRTRRHLSRPLLGLPAALLLAVPTTLRVPEWRSSLALWEAEATRPGEHWVRGHKLGTALGKVGRFAAAEAAFDRSLALNPDDMPTLARRMVASLAADGWTKDDAAVVPFLEPPPVDERGWMRAAEALRRAGRQDLAAMALRRAERVVLGH